MNVQRINAMQRLYGFADMQEKINSGLAWKLEGSVGREAMSQLESGACMLPKVPRFDTYGNKVPSRDMIKAGTKGSFKNSQDFWTKVDVWVKL